MNHKVSVWVSRALMIIFLIFLCSTGGFGWTLAVLFSALVLFFSITSQIGGKEKKRDIGQ
ncbi:hypothetical protein [Ectobacillus ponti]|uniref:Uncharacterized protein n=1 Tax=Ectobacillus ponti TaxID=2961894 RepID=A0AA41XB45_9BACI|nr:hypothetical protein [Ectobacillus ponti]MCP8970443.1 hypothetical protein [Ectobacillus ponti]